MEKKLREANSLLPNIKKKIPAFYGRRQLVTVFAITRFLSVFWARWVQYIPYSHMHLRSILIIFFPRLRLQVVSFLQVSPPKLCKYFCFPYAFKIPLIPHPQWFYHINNIWWVQIMKLAIMEFSPCSLDWSYYHSFLEIRLKRRWGVQNLVCVSILLHTFKCHAYRTFTNLKWFPANYINSCCVPVIQPLAIKSLCINYSSCGYYNLLAWTVHKCDLQDTPYSVIAVYVYYKRNQ